MAHSLLISLVYLISLGYISCVNAQWEERENELVHAYNAILDSEEDDSREKAHEAFYDLMITTAADPGSWEYPFKKLVTISKLIPDDESFRMFTWNLQNDAGEHTFFGIIQMNPNGKLKARQSFFVLENNPEDISQMVSKTYQASGWPGAVYYELVTVKRNGKKYYTLAGWRGVNQQLTHKLLDVMYFQGGVVKFGYPLFKGKERTQRRVLFTFSGKVSMLLIYDQNAKRFVFDHLAPLNNIVSNNPKFYGPDGSYDSFVYEKKQWILQEKYDARNKGSSKDVFYNPAAKPVLDD